MTRTSRHLAFALAFTLAPLCAQSQRAPVGPAVRSFVRVDTAVLALTNVRVIDGTGAAPREGRTVARSPGVDADAVSGRAWQRAPGVSEF